MRSRQIKYLWCTPCLLFPVHTLLYTRRAFSKLNNAVWCDMIIALFQQPGWRLARASRRKMLIIKSPQQQDRTPWKQQLLYKSFSWNCSLSCVTQCTEPHNGCSKGPFKKYLKTFNFVKSLWYQKDVKALPLPLVSSALPSQVKKEIFNTSWEMGSDTFELLKILN